MTMRVVAVFMLDVATFHEDEFFVKTSDTTCDHVRAHQNGTVTVLNPEPMALEMVDASIQKFKTGYLLQPPLELASREALVGLLGRFQIVSETTCRLRR